MERDPITAAWAIIIISLFIVLLCWELGLGIADSLRALGAMAKAWWQNRRPAKGWQPKPSWKRPGIRRPR